MNGIELKKALHTGQYVFGTMVTSPSPMWLPVIKKLELDFVFIDTEHIPLDRETVANMCQMYNAIGVSPIVRVPSPDPYQACSILDGGAVGIVAPYIETVEQVKILTGAVKWRPLKGKILEQFLNGNQELTTEISDYLVNFNRDKLLIINIESVPAMKILDNIVSVKGLDAILIGPHDLSISLGIPEQYNRPEFNDAIKLIAKKGRDVGIGVGNHFSSGIGPQINWAREGVNMIINSSDINSFLQSMNSDLNIMKQSLGIGFNLSEYSVDI